MKIADKIRLSFLITGLLLTSVTASVIYVIVKADRQSAIFEQLRTIAQSRANHIQALLAEQKDKVQLVANSALLKIALEAPGVGLHPSEFAFTEDLKTELERFLRTDKNVYEVLVLSPAGKIIVSTDEGKIGADRSSDTYFLNGQHGTYIKDAYRATTAGDRPSIAISTPILGDDDGKLLGVLVAKFALTDLNAITTDSMGLGASGEIYLVNKDGYMITPSRFMTNAFLMIKANTFGTRKYSEKTETAEEQPTVYMDYRGARVLGWHELIPEMQWCLLAEIDEKEALAPLVRLRLLLLIVMLFVPTAAWLIGILFSRFITKPLYQLHKGTEIVGDGNLDHKVGTDAKDEIGQLSRAFDEMTDNLKKTTASREELARQIAQRKQVEQQLAVKNRQLQDANRLLAEQAQVDELTGLANRRKFLEILSAEAERIGRYPAPLSLVMCDIDHFKQINDTFGHAFGDRVLCEVAAKLDDGSRTVDTVTRYGGDEFIIIMPNTSSNDAFRAAERLRNLLANTVIVKGKHNIRVTASFGVAGVEEGSVTSCDELMRPADEALYAAKRAGRNCTVSHQDLTKKRAPTQTSAATGAAKEDH